MCRQTGKKCKNIAQANCLAQIFKVSENMEQRSMSFIGGKYYIFTHEIFESVMFYDMWPTEDGKSEWGVNN